MCLDLAHDGYPFMWWPCSVMLNFGFQEWVLHWPSQRGIVVQIIANETCIQVNVEDNKIDTNISVLQCDSFKHQLIIFA